MRRHRRHSRRERNPFLRLRGEMLEDRRLLTVINWSGTGDGTSWGSEANWFGGVVPSLATDDAVINVGGSPTIVFSSGSTNIHSLTK